MGARVHDWVLLTGATKVLKLTKQQFREFFRLLDAGETPSAIAPRFDISRQTACTYSNDRKLIEAQLEPRPLERVR